MEFSELFHKLRVFRNAFFNEADDTALINQIGNSPPSIEFLNRFIIVGYERKTDHVLFRKFVVCIDAVCADANDLGIQCIKFFQIPLEGYDFVGSDRRKDSKIERQNDIFLTDIIRQLNFTLSGISTE